MNCADLCASAFAGIPDRCTGVTFKKSIEKCIDILKMIKFSHVIHTFSGGGWWLKTGKTSISGTGKVGVCRLHSTYRIRPN